jgi:DNA-binding transcriptional ArsR family regulator
MPDRVLITRELGLLLGILSHPVRIRIVEELREGERDVSSLQQAVGISHAGVSQHLSLLRAHRVVAERREGRHVYYHLRQPELAGWLMMGLRFLEGGRESCDELLNAVERVRAQWPDSLEHAASDGGPH